MPAAAPPISRRFCANHPQRPAMGVCVITGTPICGECSTRYEGVNYSREGLRVLQDRRLAAAAGRGGRAGLLRVAAVLAVPVMLYAVYASYVGSAYALMSLLRPDR